MSSVVTYNCLQDFGWADSDKPDQISRDPHWLICVLRLANPYTFDRNSGASRWTDFAKAVDLRGPPLLITDCLNVSVTGSKSGHITQMQATLVPNETDYLSQIFPGDHVFVWMVNSKQKMQELIRRIMDNKHCNRFRDGLKFEGRLATPRKRLSIDPTSGTKSVRYTLAAAGFTEFDASYFYDPHLAQKDPAIGESFSKMGITEINDLIDENGQGIETETAINVFLELFLGKGIPPNFGMTEKQDPALRSTTGLEAPYSYTVPDRVGAFLNRTHKSKASGLSSYADLLETIQGVQEYAPLGLEDLSAEERNGKDAAEDEVLYGQMFTPTGARVTGSRKSTGTPMVGTFLPTAPQFSGKTVWTILNQYLNPALNEMYTCLRVNVNGLVVPTLIVRQIPFTTNGAFSDLPTTKFLNLPRWKIDPLMVENYDLGRSDAMRINFLHIYGDPTGMKGVGLDFTSQLIRNPPIRDDLDIARSGLRPYMMTVNCHVKDINTGGPGKWMEIMSDYVMGMHMVFTGTLTVKGIQAPIVVGDNLEWDDIVYHIEGITHSCTIGADGRKSFTTNFSLSHGVAANPVDNVLGVYGGMDEATDRVQEPGYSFEDEHAASSKGHIERPIDNALEILLEKNPGELR